MIKFSVCLNRLVFVMGTCSKMDLFKFLDKYSKELRCLMFSGKYGFQPVERNAKFCFLDKENNVIHLSSASCRLQQV